ncbi:hypothetical protein PU629_14675 [Pullulanibacillus sp. KACC 23026]|uniref:hypothetical protein n=1 Tax=Pullulanibacillus sp. KACC 23026 TaxID=3028315 RepID=UPI0023B193E8|nr:hypothetical protein [Pullulanibacillus sp. KACC 23026]WEG11401.1 hypothetical protein PU629_14675 [Pullulanibacillus sp. KACC 23026]
MRIYGWLVVGFFLCHESLMLFSTPSKGESSLFNLIYHPVLFFQASLLMLMGLYLATFSFRYALIVTRHERVNPSTKFVYGLIYSATFLAGWGWLIVTLVWGGLLLLFLSVILYLLWEK